MATKPDLSRVLERPNPSDWADDELLTLPEAAELFWPRGPLKTASLRTAARDGQLAIVVTRARRSRKSFCFGIMTSSGSTASGASLSRPKRAR